MCITKATKWRPVFRRHDNSFAAGPVLRLKFQVFIVIKDHPLP